jgi:hypothetical protein
VIYQGEVITVTGSLLKFSVVTDTKEVMLGPPWYWSENGIALNPGDSIELEVFEIPDFLMGLNWVHNLTTDESYHLYTPEGLPVWRP